jgi:hypothetical protein
MKVDPDQNRLKSQDMLYLGLILLVILSIAFLLPVEPNDYWWYIRIGKETLQSGAVPNIDTLSYTQTGQPVIYHSWLSAILFTKISQYGGIPGTVFIRGLMIAMGYVVTFIIARQSGAGTRITSLVTVLAALATSNNWTVRPQMFTYFLFAAVLWVIYDWQRGSKKSIWLLLLISLFWINLHGSFVMLFILVITALIFGSGDRKKLAVTLILSLLITLVNPRGLDAWKYVFISLNTASNQLYSMEWRPPANLGWQMHIFFAWLLLFIPLIATSKRRISKLEWIWLLVFGWLALSGQRYVIWFVFILTILTACLLAEWGNLKRDKPGQPGGKVINITIGILFMLLPLALLPGIRAAWWPQAPDALANTPIDATIWLLENPDIPGPLWSEIGFSSYLEYFLPARSVWNDTRFEVYPIEQWDRYQVISNAEWDWQKILDEEGINLLVISKEIQPNLLTALRASPNWINIHEDDVAVIFERDGSK